MRFQLLTEALEKCSTVREVDIAEITTSLSIAYFANDNYDIAKQHLEQVIQCQHLCPQALFVTAALGLFAFDLSLTEYALGMRKQ